MEKLAQAFKALSHENRLMIVRMLMQREYECCHPDEEDCSLEEPTCDFGELTEQLDIHKSTLSHHLKELRYAGLIEAVKEGRCVKVRVNRDKVKQLRAFFDLDLETAHEFAV